jgi:hypothetical protein
MAAVSAYAEKASLDWLLLGATPTRPGTNACGLSLGAPTSVSGSEITTGSGYARQTAGFIAAASPGGSATNTNAMTFGPFSGACSITGIQIWDTILTLNSGNMLWYGNLATARTLGIGDSLVIASGALTVSLA